MVDKIGMLGLIDWVERGNVIEIESVFKVLSFHTSYTARPSPQDYSQREGVNNTCTMNHCSWSNEIDAGIVPQIIRFVVVWVIHIVTQIIFMKCLTEVFFYKYNEL